LYFNFKSEPPGNILIPFGPPINKRRTFYLLIYITTSSFSSILPDIAKEVVGHKYARDIHCISKRSSSLKAGIMP
jgi:hypothetical protein